MSEINEASELTPHPADAPHPSGAPRAPEVPYASEAPRLPAVAQAQPQRPSRLPAPVRTLEQRTQQLLSRSLPLARYRLMRLGWPGLSGLALAVAAIAVAAAVLLPAYRSIVDLGAQIAQTAHMPPAVVKPEQSVHQFSASLPTREQVPAVLGVLIAQAAAAGVVLDQGRYTYTPPTNNRLGRYAMDFPVKGDYANVRDFIDRSLKEVPSLGLDKLRVERKNVGDLAINADVGFVVYLRGS